MGRTQGKGYYFVLNLGTAGDDERESGKDVGPGSELTQCRTACLRQTDIVRQAIKNRERVVAQGKEREVCRYLFCSVMLFYLIVVSQACLAADYSAPSANDECCNRVT